MVIKELTIANNFVAGFTLDVTFVMLIKKHSSMRAQKTYQAKPTPQASFSSEGS